MDFESPDDIEKTINRRQQNQMKKTEIIETPTPKKLNKTEETFKPEFEYDMEGSSLDSESDYELPVNTGSSMDSADSESDYEDTDVGGFKRLDTDKKRLLIKDGRIVKSDKLKKNPASQRTKSGKKTPKTSPGSFVANSFESSSISPTSPRNKDSFCRVAPIDVAAHLKLLGESLTIIGERLKEHEGQIAVSGSLSVLLDSLLCALGPLLCLTQQIPELQENCCNPEQLINTLDNVAFIMPGL